MHNSLHSLQRISFLPPLLTIIVFGGLIARAMNNKDAIEAGYRTSARQAVADEDGEQAKFYYTRLVGAGDRGSRQDQLNWVSILSASGDQKAAKEQLDQLAPDDEFGFGPAHLEKAKMLSSAQSRPPGLDGDQLKKLGWHLRHGASEPGTQNNLMWANYFLAIEQVDNAVARFEAAAGQKPELWFEIAALYRRLNRKDDFDRAHNRAETHAVNQLESDPHDVGQRIRLIAILADQKRFDEVETLMSEGLRLSPNDVALRSTASNLALARLSLINQDEPDANQQRMLLMSQAATFNVNNVQLYAKLTEFYQQAKTDEQRSDFRDQLESWIAGGKAVPHAHLALGNLLWQESKRDDAILHFESALEMDPSMSIIANNLAWALCKSDSPDLERAEKLIRLAMKSNPMNHSFRDTLGTILFEQKRYREALTFFEQILPNARGAKKKDLHRQLAIIYSELGQENLAARHREQTQSE